LVHSNMSREWPHTPSEAFSHRYFVMPYEIGLDAALQDIMSPRGFAYAVYCAGQQPHYPMIISSNCACAEHSHAESNVFALLMPCP
jgi:hypothetical protein